MYEGTVIRPPSEAGSVIVQATLGCSHNSCTFCPTYIDKPFREKELDAIFEDIEVFKRHEPGARRVFLADGNALVMDTTKLLKILDRLNEAFPRLQRIGIYANARDINRKPHKDLESFAKRKLGIFYMGLESGSDEVLRLVKKGATAASMVEAVRKGQEAGIKASVIALVGLGGKDLSREHAVETGKIASAMSPRFLSFLTLMIVPGTPLYDEMQSGRFQPLDAREGLDELRVMIDNLDVSGKGTIVRSNHASNYLPLGGTFPKDKDAVLAAIDACLSGDVEMRPEWLRGL